MNDSSDRSADRNVSQETAHSQRPVKRPKIKFVNPEEWPSIQPITNISTRKVADRNLCQRLLDRQAKIKQETSTHELSFTEESRPRRRQKHLKSRRGRPRKRPIDPRRPWIESDDEEDDYAAPMDDDSDDDAFLQRLAEEKEREEAEEIKRKQELQRLRRLKREERRSRATGRPGRPRTQIAFAHLYANSTDDPQSSSKPSDTSDAEPSPLNDLPEIEEEDEHDMDFPPPPNLENDNSDEIVAGNLEASSVPDIPRINAVVTRRKAPPLVLPASSEELTCPSEYLLDALSIFKALRRYGRLLRLSPFQLEDFLSALVANENSSLLAAIHIALLNALILEDEANGTQFCPPDCKDAISLLLSFLADRYTWPYILSLYLSSVKRGESAALAALARVGNNISSIVANGPNAAVTFSGGADSVLTSSLFYSDDDGVDNIIPLDPSYPFVGLSQRIAVLRGLVGLYLATGPVRADILREGFTAHDDFCRVCRQSGEVLCCDTCPAVFHLTCLTPPLEAVPNSSWHCPLCEVEQKIYGDKKIKKMRGETQVSPLGYDRAGRAYWHMEGRLFVEPINFAQREPKLPGLTEGVLDAEWERLEVEDPTCDDEDNISDTNPDDNENIEKVEEGDDGMKKSEEEKTDPSVAYANEPPVYHYCSLESIAAVRERLSTRWEPGLCSQLDSLISQMEARQTKSKPVKIESKEQSEEVKKDEDKSEQTLSKWPPVMPLPPALTTLQLTALFSKSQSLNRATGASSPMQNAFVLELSGGVLVHNQDGLFENFPLTPDAHIQRLLESRPALVHASVPSSSLAAPSERWRGWTNTLGQGLFVPNPTTESSELSEVNIALSRPQMHDEREKRRMLANKFCLSDAALQAWRWLDAEAGSAMIRQAIGDESFDSSPRVNRRADAVGPLRWLHTMKLTLCFMEAQLPAAVLCPAWRLLRKDWLGAVLKATSVQELADLLARLEAAIRPIAFQRTWTSSIGPLQLDRFTSAQREEEKRNRVLERSSAAFNALPATLVRTKTIQPIRHTVWKTRGEEYRRLGGDGWQWVSATRRQLQADDKRMTLQRLRAKLNGVERPPHLGLGWGVKQELLQQASLHPPLPRQSTRVSRNDEMHPISGVPLSRNVPRNVYRIPPEIIENLPNGVIDISKCLSEGGGKFFPPPLRPLLASHQSLGRGRTNFRLDSLLAMREAAAARDEAASIAASTDLSNLREQREALASKVASIRSRLNELSAEAQEVRSEHARAVKARQAAIAEAKEMNEKRLSQSYYQGTIPIAPSTPVGGGAGALKPKSRPSILSTRRSSGGRSQKEDSNYDSGGSAESSESAATASSKPTSSNTESNHLRRSSRRQKTKNVDPDFVVDFGEDEEEEEEEELDSRMGRKIDLDGDYEDLDNDGPSWAQGRRGIPQFDGAGDDEVYDEAEEGGEDDDYGVDENNIEIGPGQSRTSNKASSSGSNETLAKVVTVTPTSGKSLLALAIEGKAPGILPTKQLTSNDGPPTEPRAVTVVATIASSSISTTTTTTTTTTTSGQPVRLVRFLRAPAGTPTGTQIIQPVDSPTASTSSNTGNLIIPASTESALQKSLMQLSSSGSVIVTQASAIPAGYRLITPSSLSINATPTVTTPISGSRIPLNFVQVVSTPGSQAIKPRPLVPQSTRPSGQVVSITKTGGSSTPSLISIAPSPVVVRVPGVTPIRPQLLAPANRPIVSSSPNLAPNLRPRVVRMVPQPIQLDPSLDKAVNEAANKLHQVDMEIFSLRKELRHLESELAELTVRVEEKENLVSRSGRPTSEPYSLNSYATSLLARLNNAVKVKTVASATKHRSKGRQFLRLPDHLPPINPYAWPPDSLYRATVSPSYPQIQKDTSAPVSNLFSLSRGNLRTLILAAGRKEMPGYEAEKKRLASVTWLYPTARPCFAEAWRFRLRQIVHLPQTIVSHCGELNTPSHYGILMASLATHLRLLWHSLRWDEIVISPGVCEDATMIADRYYLKQSIPESHGGGHSLRRVVAIKPTDKYWLRAKFLVQTTIQKPSTRKRAARGNSRNVANGNSDTPASRRTGRGNKRFADPDYDPAADEGWRVGIPCSASSRRRRRTNYAEAEEEDDEGNEMDTKKDVAADVAMGAEQDDSDAKRSEEWMNEEELQLWEIRAFMDSLLPIDSDYPPPMPPIALTGLPANLIEEVSSSPLVMDNEKKEGAEVAESQRGSWIQSARCFSPEGLRSTSPKPPSPPQPPPPPPSLYVMETAKPGSVGTPKPLITPSTPTSQPTFRPLIVNSSRPPVLRTPLITTTPSSGSASRQRVPGEVRFTPKGGSLSSTSNATPSSSAPRRTGAPLSPNSEAARARARSIAASHAARISAANRRFRNEKAALSTRVAALVEELANRRKLHVKFLALQVQEEILQERKAAQREAMVEPPLPPQPKPSEPSPKVERFPVSSRRRRRGASGAKPLATALSPSSSRRHKRQRGTPSTDPATDSNEEHYVISKRRRQRKAEKMEYESPHSPSPPALSLKTEPTTTPRNRRVGRSVGLSNSKSRQAEDVQTPSIRFAKTSSTSSTRKKVRGKGGKGGAAPKTKSLSTHLGSKAGGPKGSASKQRLAIRTPKYLLDEAEAEKKRASSTGGGSRSLRRSNEESNFPLKEEALDEPGKVYCICKKPYDPQQAYIGCDLCQDWFHFTCVGLEPGTTAATLGDSWLCPECRSAEEKAKDEVYCLCRTPYDPTRVYIACDRCDEWYHAECLGMDPEAAAKHEGQYICPSCVKKDGAGGMANVGGSTTDDKNKAGLGMEAKGKVGLESEDTPKKKKTLYEAPLTEAVKEAVLELFNDLEAHKLSWPFMKSLPSSSLSSMKGPTDLLSFRASFERGVYRSLGDISFAGNRLFSNARLVFDAASTEFHCVEVLEAFFLRRMKEVRSISEHATTSPPPIHPPS